MGYTTITFLVFVAVIAVLFFCFPVKYRWTVLLAASYVFYWLSSRFAIVYILTTTASTFYAGILLGNRNANYEDEKKALSDAERKEHRSALLKGNKLILVLTLIVNFGILCVLKYGNFFTENINAVLSFLKIGSLPMTSFVLPVGISFYTFQSMGYIIDIHRDKYKPDRNFFKFALFVSFFPQIVQGPIGRYDELASTLFAPTKFDYDRVKNGVLLMAYGFAKKLIIADRAQILVETVFDKGTFADSGSVVFFGAIIYGLQIYCDFSGGIDISRGVAEIFGINLAQNFQRPYFAKSVQEYWRRWHITLGAWMREYLFFPLLISVPIQKLTKKIRNRYGVMWARIIPNAIVSFIVFIVVGIWHGPYWKRVAYGIWNGTIITTSIMLEPTYAKVHKLFGTRTDAFSYKLFCCIRTFVLVTFARYFARSANLTTALGNLKLTFLAFNPERFLDGTLLKLGITSYDFSILLAGVVVLLIIGSIQERGHSVRYLLSQQNVWFRWIVYAAMIIVFMFFPISSKGIVKEFIYAQF